MTDWRRKAAEKIVGSMPGKHSAHISDELLQSQMNWKHNRDRIAQIISQAEPERKGLEECAREIAFLFPFPAECLDSEKGEDLYESLTKERADKILPILRTLAPECHIEAAIVEALEFYADEGNYINIHSNPARNSPVKEDCGAKARAGLGKE